MRFSIREKQVSIRSVFACCVFALAVFLTREARAEALTEAKVKERIEKEVEDVKKSMGSVESCSFEKIRSVFLPCFIGVLNLCNHNKRHIGQISFIMSFNLPVRLDHCTEY
ncbi:hypothetical protein NECID01_0058 [Nematocida sp. AWRm77]|nr:hypothetical protein NECID01_0058 [Nematocida sp. AWRm77]